MSGNCETTRAKESTTKRVVCVENVLRYLLGWRDKLSQTCKNLIIRVQ